MSARSDDVTRFLRDVRALPASASLATEIRQVSILRVMDAQERLQAADRGLSGIIAQERERHGLQPDK